MLDEAIELAEEFGFRILPVSSPLMGGPAPRQEAAHTGLATGSNDRPRPNPGMVQPMATGEYRDRDRS
jgi:hypothetical protein